MALRDINWPYSRSSAYNSPDPLATRSLIDQWRPAPGLLRQCLVRPDQQALGAPDRGAVQYHAEVRRQTHPAQVGIALRIAKQQIRHRLQFPQGSEQGGNLPEAQQTGDVRKIQRQN